MPYTLSILTELRERAGLSQEQAARYCGLRGRQSRKTIGEWEMGNSVPRANRRVKIIGYLWHHLQLRQDPALFDAVWDVLVEEWGWDPLRADERIQHGLTPAAETAAAASGATLPPLAMTEAESDECPFKGLQHFDVADAHLFFGREALTAELVERLHHQTFLAVIGASGSGKSSLVRAGVAAALASSEALPGGMLPPPGSTAWQRHIITPTAHPLRSLAVSLAGGGESVADVAQLMDSLARDARTLDLYVPRLLGTAGGRTAGDDTGKRLLLIVDQFEELFTLCQDPDERRAFVDNLLTAAETGDQTTVLITLRADFYAHCTDFSNLRTALESNQKYIGAMNTEELRRSIEEPARRGGWSLEAGLTDLFMDDIGSEPAVLPLLSHALVETWKRRQGRMMTVAGYIDAGRVQGAITQTAERVFTQQFTPEQQSVSKNIFLRLTQPGNSAADTRQRLDLADLASIQSQHSLIHTTLQLLADARLITIYESEVEVAHEALIREWQRLREWLDEDRENLQIRQRLIRSAREWQQSGRDPAALLRGTFLASTLTWADGHTAELTGLEQEFLLRSALEAGNESLYWRTLVQTPRRRVTLLESFLAGADATVRARIVRLLAQEEPAVAMEPLLHRALSDPDYHVRMLAQASLAQAARIDGAVLTRLHQLLESEPLDATHVLEMIAKLPVHQAAVALPRRNVHRFARPYLRWFNSWLLANVLGLGSVVSIGFIGLSFTGTYLGFLVGYLLVGLAQWLVLRPYLRSIRWWVATTLGWFTALTVMGYFNQTPVDTLISVQPASEVTMRLPAPGNILLNLFGGAIAGATQWLVLRTHARGAGWWVFASALGLGVGGLLNGALGTPLDQMFLSLLSLLSGEEQRAIWGFVISWVRAGLFMGLAYGVVTGLPILRLLHNPIEPDAQ